MISCILPMRHCWPIHLYSWCALVNWTVLTNKISCGWSHELYWGNQSLELLRPYESSTYLHLTEWEKNVHCIVEAIVARNVQYHDQAKTSINNSNFFSVLHFAFLRPYRHNQQSLTHNSTIEILLNTLWPSHTSMTLLKYKRSKSSLTDSA